MPYQTATHMMAPPKLHPLYDARLLAEEPGIGHLAEGHPMRPPNTPSTTIAQTADSLRLWSGTTCEDASQRRACVLAMAATCIDRMDTCRSVHPVRARSRTVPGCYGPHVCHCTVDSHKHVPHPLEPGFAWYLAGNCHRPSVRVCALAVLLAQRPCPPALAM